MAKVIQIQYVPKSKRQTRGLLIALDDQGAVWYAVERKDPGHFVWHSVALPDNLEYEDDVEVIDLSDMEPLKVETFEHDLKTKEEVEEKDG